MKNSCILILLAIAMTVPAGQSVAAQAATKYCALTFDDGPDVVKTPRVLERLEKYGVVATFFQVGQNINSTTKGVIDRIIKDGCEIGNHSWGYDGLNNATAEQIKSSVDRTTEAIKQYSGTTPKFFRAPNLAASQTMYDTIALPFASGVLGMDWAGTNTDAATRAQNVLNGMRDGAIILLHDVQPDPHPTPEALDILIPELKKQGYTFVTLSELFRIKGVDPASRKNIMWQYVP